MMGYYTRVINGNVMLKKLEAIWVLQHHSDYEMTHSEGGMFYYYHHDVFVPMDLKTLRRVAQSIMDKCGLDEWDG